MGQGNFDKLAQLTKDLIYEGYPMSSILPKLLDDVITHATLSDVDKALICDKLAQVEQCLVDGSSEALQLLDTAAFISRRLTGLSLSVDAVLAHS